MHRFRVLGITDSPGHCELCGTFCPARRVAVALEEGDVQYWGVVCAAEARSGRRDGTIARMLRQEAEEAGEYDAPAEVRRRGPRPAVRRQTRREADRLAAIAATDARIVWTRAAAPVPDEYATETGTDAAAYRYRLTGRRIGAAYFATDEAGRVAVIDGADFDDVARFERHGFKPSQWGRLADWRPASTVTA